MNPTPLSNTGHSSAQRMRAYLIELQARITSAIEGVEGQRGDEQAHGEADAAEQRDAINLSPCRIARSLREAGFHGIATEWWHFDFGERAAIRRDGPRVD